MTTYGKQFANEVAVRLDRRRRRRRLVMLTLVAGLIAAAAMYLRCGSGWGLGGFGTGAGNGEGAAVREPARCRVRVSATGITVDGKPATRDGVVAACKNSDGALVIVTGDARQGDWDALRGALDAAGIKIYSRNQ